MSIVVSLINMKGGVGKTTLTVNLAFEAARRGKKTLVVDLDPQSNASQYLMGPSGYKSFIDGQELSVKEIFEQFSTLNPNQTNIAGRDLIKQRKANLFYIPSTLELSWTLKNPSQKENLLNRFLKREASDFDIILIDCPPTESMFSTAAYLASEYVLIPVVAEYLSTVGLPLMARSLDAFHRQYETDHPEVAGIVFNAIDDQNNNPESRKAASDAIDLAAGEGWYIFDCEIGYSRSYPRGPRAGTPIAYTDYARWDVKQEFSAFANEFFRRIEGGQ